MSRNVICSNLMYVRLMGEILRIQGTKQVYSTPI